MVTYFLYVLPLGRSFNLELRLNAPQYHLTPFHGLFGSLGFYLACPVLVPQFCGLFCLFVGASLVPRCRNMELFCYSQICPISKGERSRLGAYHHHQLGI